MDWKLASTRLTSRQLQAAQSQLQAACLPQGGARATSANKDSGSSTSETQVNLRHITIKKCTFLLH